MASDLKNILTEVQETSRTGNRRGLTASLRQLLGNRRAYYWQSVEEKLLDDYADALYKILLLELDEEEEFVRFYNKVKLLRRNSTNDAYCCCIIFVIILPIRSLKYS